MLGDSGLVEDGYTLFKLAWNYLGKDGGHAVAL
jgi:hypothetical protein